MDVINKFHSIYSSVSSTVSQLSGVLPGNPVTREYEVSTQIASAGIGLFWKIYSGVKKSTKEEVSVFVFEKKQLEKYSKDDRENILEILRRGVQQLTKIRHPHVLTVQHPLEESRDSLAFATEPVYSSLSNILSENQNSRSEKKLFDVEIKHGILQLVEGLQFLHADAKIVHRNLTIENIIINKQRSWKIFGFDFCIAGQTKSDGSYFWTHQEHNSSLNVLTQPSLEYTAPEVALNSIITPESDVYSLGVIIYSVYSGGKPLKYFGNDFGAFRRFASELSQNKYPRFNDIPDDMADSLRDLLHASPQHRLKLHELPKIIFFQDVGVKTLNYLDSLYQWDNLHKSKFYKGLPEIIPTLPHRVNIHCILPYLVKEFINSTMVPFVLPNVLLIAENSTQKEYCDHILPHLKPIMKLQEPIQILLIFMQKMNLLLKLTPAEEVKLHVLPLLYRSLETEMPQIQELCLNILPTFSALIDYNATKNALLPRIKKLCIQSQNVSVKVNCLICIGKLLENLDKWIVLDEILPFVAQIQSREPAVIMAVIGIYKIAMSNTKLGITKEVMATKVIPFLMPLCIENGLTIAQFNTIIGLLKEMVNRVEKEHREKLEQLSTIQKETKPLQASDFLANELSQSVDDFYSSNSSNSKTKQSEGLKLAEYPKPINSSKPDLLNSLVNSNSIEPREIKPSKPLQFEYPKVSNTATNSNWTNAYQTAPQPTVNDRQTTASRNMNWNKPSPVTKSNNNTSSLISFSSLDPLQNANVQVPMNRMVTSPTSPPPSFNLLSPSNETKTDNTLNTLSQQDILNFLN